MTPVCRWAALLVVAVTQAAPRGADADVDRGSITGVVVNGSDGERPIGAAEVVLRATTGGPPSVVAMTLADEEGVFRFDRLPCDARVRYVPGASRADVHYPGPRVRLTMERPDIRVRLSVHDAVTGPNPLVIRHQEIVLRSEPGGLEVTETLRIDNPSSTCYVGRTPHEGSGPITLRLAIPANFVRVTFDQEFYGRRFTLVDGQLVTGIPWPPGSRELKFRYVMADTAGDRTWQRRLDLPCSRLQLTVHGSDGEKISANLPQGATEIDGGAIFESVGSTLPTGHPVRVELGSVRVPMMAYGRWAALALLLGLVAMVGLTAALRVRT